MERKLLIYKMKYFLISVALILLEISNGFGSISNVKNNLNIDRRKRDTYYKNIPAPPSLPDLDVQNLPSYIRNLVALETPGCINRIGHRVDKSDCAYYHKKKYLPIKRKTDGMNLTNGKGYVWNDVTAPKVLYHVGEKEPDNVEEVYANDQNTSNTINTKTTTAKTRKNIPDSVLSDIINGLDDAFYTLIRKNHTEVLKSKNTPINIGKAENVIKSPNIILKNSETKPTEISNIIDDLKDIYNTLKSNDIIVTTTRKPTISTTPENNDIVVRNIVKPTTSTKPDNDGVVARTTNKSTTLTTSDNDIIATTTERRITTPINHNAKVIDSNELKHVFSEILLNISNTNELKKIDTVDITHPSNIIDSKPIKSTMEVSNISNVTNQTSISHTDRAAKGSDPKEINDTKTNDNTSNNRINTNNSEKENNYKQEGVQPSFLENLIKDEYFWKWLNVLISKYLDLVMNRITEMIKTEVATQIEYYLKNINITTGHPNCTKTGNYITESSNNYNNIQDDFNKSVTTNFGVPTNNVNKTKTPQKSNTDLSEKHNIKEKNGTYLNSSTHVLNNLGGDNNTNAQETNGTKPAEVIHKNSGTSIVNNNSDNINNSTKNNVTLDKHKKNNISIDKIKYAPVKFNAQTIYGNSVGNEKVTNIYIFQVNNVSDINDLKPASTALTGFFTLGPHQNTFITDDNNSTASQTNSTKTDHETVIPNDMESNNSILSHNDETVTTTEQIDVEKSTNEPTTNTSQSVTSSETTTIGTTSASR